MVPSDRVRLRRLITELTGECNRDVTGLASARDSLLQNAVTISVRRRGGILRSSRQQRCTLGYPGVGVTAAITGGCLTRQRQEREEVGLRPGSA